MKRAVVVFVCLGLFFSPKAQAARAPEIVERTFQVEGEAAKEIAKALGIEAVGGHVLTLLWDLQAGKRNCSYGPRDSEAGWVHCDDIPQNSVQIEYHEDPAPSLRLSGRWQDMSTASGPRLREFTVPSPSFGSLEAIQGDWQRISRNRVLQCESEQSLVESSKPRTDPPYFRISCHKLFDGRVMLILHVDFESPQDRALKLREYKGSLSLLD